jgi:hypothetical protein
MSANFPDVGITLTTIGTSGLATLVGSTLNIPNYSAFSSPTLQSVTDEGNTTTNYIQVQSATTLSVMYNNQIGTFDFNAGSGVVLDSLGLISFNNGTGDGVLSFQEVLNSDVTFNLPNKPPTAAYTLVTLDDLSTGFVPYTGATTDLDLGDKDLYVNEIFLYDGPNDNYGSVHYTDGNFHIEDGDGHPLLVIEDEFIQLHKSATIQSNLWTSGLSETRDHYLPNQSGTIALTSDITPESLIIAYAIALG